MSISRREHRPLCGFRTDAHAVSVSPVSPDPYHPLSESSLLTLTSPKFDAHCAVHEPVHKRVFDSLELVDWDCGGKVGPKPYAATLSPLRYCMGLL